MIRTSADTPDRCARPMPISIAFDESSNGPTRTPTSTVGTDNGKRTVRTVGPPFLSSQSSSQAAPQSQ